MVIELRASSKYRGAISGSETVAPLVQAAFVHAHFEAAHSFDHGNGRTGRRFDMLFQRFLATFHGPCEALLSLRRAYATRRRARVGGAPRARPAPVMLGDWLRRYGVAECAGTGGALLATFIARRLSTRLVIAAYAATWGETIGYAGAVFARDLATEARVKKEATTWRRVVLDLVAEFGPAGVLDTLVTRPLIMAVGVHTLGAVRGVIAGKLVADVVFYVPVILMYERRKRRS